MTFDFFISQSLVFIIPLLVVAIAGMFSERSGTVNIALDSIMIVGALVGILFINRTQHLEVFINNPQLMVFISVLLAGLAGVAFSALLGFSAINMQANQTISGTSLNMIGPALAIFLARQTSNPPIKQIYFEVSRLYLGGKVFTENNGAFLYGINNIFFDRIYLTTYLGILIWIISYIVIYKTRFGLRLISCGENPEAAQSVGINVYKYRWLGILISGLLGGIGGVTYIIGTTSSFEGTVQGYGFLALAVLIFGSWRPGKIFLAAIFFGLFQTLSAVYSEIGFIKSFMTNNLNVNLGLFFRILPYIATMILLIITPKSSRGPKASGVPFNYKAK